VGVDCLVIGAAEFDRNREREIFLKVHRGDAADGWGRFLALNYVEFEGDALMANQLASIAHRSARGALARGGNGFTYADVSVLSSWRTPLLGGMWIYQALKQRGFEVALVQHVQLQAAQLEAALAEQPRAIAISTTLITSPLEMKALVRLCRERSPSSYIVLGGMSIWNQFQVKKAENELLRSEAAREDEGDLLGGFGFLGADALIVDPYGIETLAELLGRLKTGRSLDGLPNTVRYARGVPVSRLDRTGEVFDAARMRMDWDLVENEHIGSVVNVRTQISCPFRCSFCSYPTTQGPVIKAEFDAFERELQALSRRGVDTLMIIDDTFNVPPKRFMQVLEILRRYQFRWYSFIRCQFLDAAQVDMMKASGCVGVYLGLESVDDETLERMNKTATEELFRRGIGLLAERGILTYASFIVGFPGDTAETVRKVQRFIETSGLDYYNLKPFWYDHSTPIAQRAAEFGLTGQGYNWQHDRMNATQAYDLIRDLILDTRSRYVGLHSGELWEIGQFGARGLSKGHIDAVYDAHNAMLKQDLARRGTPADKARAFTNLESELGALELTPAAW